MKNSTMVHTMMWSLGLSGGLAAAMPSWAQNDPSGESAGKSDELVEIVVTAERRSLDLQKTAVSVSVRSGDELREQGKFTLQQIVEDVPGVGAGTVGNAGADNAGTGVTIRGIASNGTPVGTGLTAVSTAAVYTDGILEGVGSSFDIDRVEVLRGPQGTLYGRSATSGVIATYTRNPTFDKLGGDVWAEFGNYALRHYGAAVNLPVSDKLAFRISGNEYQRTGYYNGEGGEVKNTDARIKMLYQPIESLSMLFGAALEDNNTHTGGSNITLTPTNGVDIETYPLGHGENAFHQYWADINWNFGPATLTYLPSFRTWHQDALNIVRGPGGITIRQPLSTPFDQFITHEIRLTSNGGSPLTWLVGALWYDNRFTSQNLITNDANGALIVAADARKETKDVGVYGEVTYHATDTTRLTLGQRYDYTYVQTLENYSTPAATLIVDAGTGTSRFYNQTYKFRVEQDLSPANMMYAAVSSGFLPGDVQAATGANNTIFAAKYKEETLVSYEIGSKNRFMNNRLQVNGDVFFYRYGGFQSLLQLPDDPTTQIIVSIPARVFGGELEVQYLLTADDRVGFNYAYTDAYYVNIPAIYFDYNARELTHLGGNPQTANLSYDHTIHLPGGSTLTPHGDVRFMSSRYNGGATQALYDAGAGKYIRLDSQFIGDLNLAWNSSDFKYSVSAYVRNVADNRYKTGESVTSLTPVLSGTATLSDPRTYGMQASARF